jgi:hypothetical protein
MTLYKLLPNNKPNQKQKVYMIFHNALGSTVYCNIVQLYSGKFTRGAIFTFFADKWLSVKIRPAK